MVVDARAFLVVEHPERVEFCLLIDMIHWKSRGRKVRESFRNRAQRGS